MNETTYTLSEIRAAFAAVRAVIDDIGGAGAAETERFLMTDVENDVTAFLRGRAPWAAGTVDVDAATDMAAGREADDEALFASRHYGWLAANGVW